MLLRRLGIALLHQRAIWAPIETTAMAAPVAQALTPSHNVRGGLVLGHSLDLVRYQHCSCPGLNGEPAKKVTIEYDPVDVDQYIQIADAIEEAFPDIVVEGNETCDGRPGSFEIQTEDGRGLFSRLQTGRLPDVDVLITTMSTTGECQL